VVGDDVEGLAVVGDDVEGRDVEGDDVEGLAVVGEDVVVTGLLVTGDDVEGFAVVGDDVVTATGVGDDVPDIGPHPAAFQVDFSLHQASGAPLFAFPPQYPYSLRQCAGSFYLCRQFRVIACI